MREHHRVIGTRGEARDGHIVRRREGVEKSAAQVVTPAAAVIVVQWLCARSERIGAPQYDHPHLVCNGGRPPAEGGISAPCPIEDGLEYPYGWIRAHLAANAPPRLPARHGVCDRGARSHPGVDEQEYHVFILHAGGRDDRRGRCSRDRVVARRHPRLAHDGHRRASCCGGAERWDRSTATNECGA